MYQTQNNGSLKLDASDLAWFRRELEFIDQTQYKQLQEENRGRSIIPTQQGIPDWAQIYTWREWTQVGEAKFIDKNADDLPRVDVGGNEVAKMIKPIGDAYGWTIFDIKRSIATGMRLDAMKAAVARWAIETKTDRVLARGDSKRGLEGLFRLNSVPVTVANTKTGGGTYWSPGAKSSEVLADIYKLINAVVTRLQSTVANANDGESGGGQVFRRFRVVMPDANYLYLSQVFIGDNTGRTLLEILEKSPYIESIVPWSLAGGAAANGIDDRIVIFPPNPYVVAGIVPMEFTPLEAEKRNLEYVVDCIATTGGVVCRYPIAVGYMDAIDDT